MVPACGYESSLIDIRGDRQPKQSAGRLAYIIGIPHLQVAVKLAMPVSILRQGRGIKI